jgi:hypothetical protein
VLRPVDCDEDVPEHDLIVAPRHSFGIGYGSEVPFGKVLNLSAPACASVPLVLN